METQERKDKLSEVIVSWQKSGWILLSQANDFSAQLRKPKGNMSCVLLIILFLLGIIPGIIYMVLYSMQKDELVTITIDENGKINRTRS